MSDDADRDKKGKFLPGSPHQRNPHIKDLHKVRKKLQEAVWRATDPKEIVEMLGEIKEIARDRGIPEHVRLTAYREFFDRVLGKPAQQIELSSKNKVNVNIKAVAVLAQEMFGLTAPIPTVTNGEPPAKQVESHVVNALPDAANCQGILDSSDDGRGADGAVPALPEAVDRGPEPAEDR